MKIFFIVIASLAIAGFAYAVEWNGSYRRNVKFGNWLGMVVFIIGLMSIAYFSVTEIFGLFPD